MSDVPEYNPFGFIDPSHIAGKFFGIGRFDHCGRSDYVRGFYKGLPIEMCDMHMTERHTRTDEDGKEEESDETVFRGFWLICDFEKELSADIRLWERDKLRKQFVQEIRYVTNLIDELRLVDILYKA